MRLRADFYIFSLNLKTALLALFLLSPGRFNPYRLLTSISVRSAKLDRIRAFRGRRGQPRSQSVNTETRKKLRDDSPNWFLKMKRSASASKRGRSPTESPQPDAISPKRQERQPASKPVSRDHSPTLDTPARDTSSEEVPPPPKMSAFLQLSQDGK